jgi:hypothetical protein
MAGSGTLLSSRAARFALAAAFACIAQPAPVAGSRLKSGHAGAVGRGVTARPLGGLTALSHAPMGAKSRRTSAGWNVAGFYGRDPAISVQRGPFLP